MTPAARREAVKVAVQELGLTQRRACRLVGISRSVARYRPRSIDPPGLRDRLRALAAERRRYGYRRLWVLLRREDFPVNHKRVYRLMKENQLPLQQHTGRTTLTHEGKVIALKSDILNTLRILTHAPFGSTWARSGRRFL